MKQVTLTYFAVHPYVAMNKPAEPHCLLAICHILKPMTDER